jgi:hypothetical protein
VHVTPDLSLRLVLNHPIGIVELTIGLFRHRLTFKHEEALYANFNPSLRSKTGPLSGVPYALRARPVVLLASVVRYFEHCIEGGAGMLSSAERSMMTLLKEMLVLEVAEDLMS